MSTEIGSTSSPSESSEVTFTSFFGGGYRGRCLQMTQLNPNRMSHHYLQLTEGQVREAIEIMQTWLED